MSVTLRDAQKLSAKIFTKINEKLDMMKGRGGILLLSSQIFWKRLVRWHQSLRY